MLKRLIEAKLHRYFEWSKVQNEPPVDCLATHDLGSARGDAGKIFGVRLFRKCDKGGMQRTRKRPVN